MKTIFSLILLGAATAFAGPPEAKTTVAPEPDPWRFTLAAPGWMVGLDGNVGIGPAMSSVDVGFGMLLPHIDMVWATRAEVSKGRFGIMGELVQMGLSDGIGTDGVVRKVDVQMDQYLGDFALRWRVIEGPRGYLDVLAGVRYTNLYQEVGLQSNDEEIEAASLDFVDEIGDRLRDRVEERIGEGQFRNALVGAIDERVTDRLTSETGTEPRDRSLPNAPLTAQLPVELRGSLDRLVRRKKLELLASTLSTARAAAAAEVQAARAATAAARSAARTRATALRATVNQRVAAAKSDLQKSINHALKHSLNQRVSRIDDWWDPYIGVRARYNITGKFYVTGRGDIGGFGVGSDLMWQAEGALGYELTKQIFAEVGYRAISVDYEDNGLTYGTITHGAQVTLGIHF